jgi:hypothetical protein
MAAAWEWLAPAGGSDAKGTALDQPPSPARGWQAPPLLLHPPPVPFKGRLGSPWMPTSASRRARLSRFAACVSERLECLAAGCLSAAPRSPASIVARCRALCHDPRSQPHPPGGSPCPRSTRCRSGCAGQCTNRAPMRARLRRAGGGQDLRGSSLPNHYTATVSQE